MTKSVASQKWLKISYYGDEDITGPATPNQVSSADAVLIDLVSLPRRSSNIGLSGLLSQEDISYQ
jgi:hypothetical protein